MSAASKLMNLETTAIADTSYQDRKYIASCYGRCSIKVSLLSGHSSDSVEICLYHLQRRCYRWHRWYIL